MSDLLEQLDRIMPTALCGSVAQTVGTTISAVGFPAPIGALAEIERLVGPPLRAEVVGFRDDCTVLYPLSDSNGVRRGDRIRLTRTSRYLRVGPELLGRVIDAEGRAIDGQPQPTLIDRVSLDRAPPDPCSRPRIDEPLATGIRAIDGLLTCGKGQRMGIFSGAGVGKSVLLGMMARYTTADVIVIALVGERGREVNDFIERELGPAGLARSVVVVATSNEPALVRTQAAQREVGLAAGEPPATRGFTPAVCAALPKLVERAGRAARGSITAFYAVLVEADDPNEPISDTVRGLLDGHTWLSRKLSAKGHYPAIDVLESISRLMPDVTDDEHRQATYAVRDLLGAYRDHQDLISIGAYRRGSNRSVDAAIDMQGELDRYLRQQVEQPSTLADARGQLLELGRQYRQRITEQTT